MSSDNEHQSNTGSIIHDTKRENGSLVQDLISSIRLSIRPLIKYLFEKYFILPIGSILILCLLYGINEIIKKTTINFPASVCLMLILYAVLCISTLIFNESFTEKYLLRYLNYPCGFALRWINLYFTPAFVTLPLASWVSAGEAFTIAAVFVIGYLVGYTFIAYLCWGLEILFNIYPQEEEEQPNGDDIEKNGEFTTITDYDSRSSLGNVEIKGETSANEIPDESVNNDNNEEISFEDREGDEAFALSVLATNVELSKVITRCNTRNTEVHNTSRREGDQEPTNYRATDDETHIDVEKRDVMMSNFIIKWIDWFLYSIVFIVGIPIYFTTDYTLPLQLSVGVLLFKICMLFPPNYRRILHPILVSFSVSLLVFYIFTLMKGQRFLDTIKDYKTGRTYLHLFDSQDYPQLPGAGDFLLSLMDISIVSLSLAMYNYRKDLKKYFFVLIIPIILTTFMSFFIYPPLCYHLGISASRSLGFTGRSVTMALGTPLVQAIGGDYRLMAVTTIMSGILGVLCGDFIIFKILRVRKRDFVTRGVTLGINCGAVSTAHLLTIDPRAAAMSSLSFTLFGTFMVILAAIDPLVRVIQGLVGM